LLADARLVAPDGSVEVEVLPELGGRLHRLRFRGGDLLRTPDDLNAYHRQPFLWGSYPMAPWCNRLDAGAIEVGARRVVLASNFPDGSALHGEVMDRPWREVGPGRYAVGAGETLGWPWAYEVRLVVDVRDGGLAVTIELANLADDPMPAGVGLHPWFRRPVEIAVDARAVYASNLSPSSHPVPVTGAFDLHDPAPLARGLDATWTALRRPVVELRWPTLGVAATMTVHAPAVLVCAASPADVDADAIEPQTHAPQGLRRLLDRLPDPMTWLAPGDALALTMDLAFRDWSG
jgi:aldose 1-epimerase